MLVPQCGQVTFRDARILSRSSLPRRGIVVRILWRICALTSDDAIVSKGLGGIVTSWNKAAERIFGYTANEAVGQHINLIIPPDRNDEEKNIPARIGRGERTTKKKRQKRFECGRQYGSYFVGRCQRPCCCFHPTGRCAAACFVSEMELSTTFARIFG